MRKAAAIILGLEALLLVLAVVVFLAGESDVEIPKTVPTSSAVTKPLKASVPVSVNLGSSGTVIVTTAAFKPRGGAATPTRP